MAVDTTVDDLDTSAPTSASMRKTRVDDSMTDLTSGFSLSWEKVVTYAEGAGAVGEPVGAPVVAASVDAGVGLPTTGTPVADREVGEAAVVAAAGAGAGPGAPTGTPSTTVPAPVAGATFKEANANCHLFGSL